MQHVGLTVWLYPFLAAYTITVVLLLLHKLARRSRKQQDQIEQLMWTQMSLETRLHEYTGSSLFVSTDALRER